MINSNKRLLGLMLLIVVGLLLIGGYIIIADIKNAKILGDTAVNRNDSDENPYIENTTSTQIYGDIEKRIKTIKTINSLEELEPTAISQLKIGEAYIYHLSDNFVGSAMSYPCDPVEIDMRVDVEKIERINKTDYYVLKSERHEVYPVCYPTINNRVEKRSIGKPVNPGDRDNPVIYGGCVIGINKDDPSKQEIRLAKNWGLCRTDSSLQQNWMLYLNEDIKFVESETQEFDGKECTSKVETMVEGSEKVKDHDCFKVKREYRSNCEFSTGTKGEKQIESTTEEIFYIDKQKRITVKYTRYEFNQGGRFLSTSLELKEIKE